MNDIVRLGERALNLEDLMAVARGRAAAELSPAAQAAMQPRVRARRTAGCAARPLHASRNASARTCARARTGVSSKRARFAQAAAQAMGLAVKLCPWKKVRICA